MGDRIPVGIVGASGFLGGELVRLLSNHPTLEPTLLCASSNAGRLLGDVKPSLAGAGAWRLEATDAERLANETELVFLALPHGASAELAVELLDRGAIVVDLGSDFRLKDASDYPRYYEREHPCPDRLAGAFYSLPELTGGPPEGTRLIASPGCFATALALALVPLVPHLTEDARVAVAGVTGSSGSGASPRTTVHHSLRFTGYTAYKSLAHQHLGELRQLMRETHGRAATVDFVPHSGPFVRGIHLTVHLRRDELTADPLKVLCEHYCDHRTIGAVPGTVQLGEVVGSIRARIGVVDDKTDDGAVVVFCAIDNLLKGGSGQAVQSVNLLLGLDETAGLPLAGIWP